MGYLFEGQWTEGDPPAEFDKSGRFTRIDGAFRDRITADGSSGYLAEAGRYHLYASHTCPWAHRTILFRALKNLENVVSISHAIPGKLEQGWTYGTDPDFPDCVPDEINGFRYLHQAYTASSPNYTGKVTVPVLWDKKTGRIVSNESSEIIRMFNTAFDRLTGNSLDFYPAKFREEIDQINEVVYANVNNGVYRCGFAKSQMAYDEAFDRLFGTLDMLDARLAHARTLVNGQLTEADLRLLPTLLRFDAVYFSLFKCNKQRISDYPSLDSYVRRLLEMSAVRKTVKPRYYIISYYSNKAVNPTGIIPRGGPVRYLQ